MSRFLLAFTLLCAIMPVVFAENGEKNTFANPIVPGNCPDPWVIRHGDAYFWCRSDNGSRLIVEKLDGPLPRVSKTLGVCEAYRAGKAPTLAHLWAPELYVINGKWYLYSSAEIGSRHDFTNLRMFVLEADNWDGPYVFKGLLETPNWAIDPDILFHPNDGKMYMTWSHFDDKEADGGRIQEIWLAPMIDPVTLDAKKAVRISTPDFDWEKKLGWVNEGPQFLVKKNTVHLVYSASQCHGRYYCLGMLTASLDDDLLDPKRWKKRETPVFSEANGLYGPGHNCFVKSPDGKEDWLLYHAHSTAWETNNDHGDRAMYAQPFHWDGDTPVFGEPLKPETQLPLPSGSATAGKTYTNPAMNAADPCVLRKPTGEAVQFEGRYYLYHTGGGPKEQTLIAHSTADFSEWRNEGVVFDGSGTWAKSAYWAPEFYEIDGKYYGFFSAQSKDMPWTQEEHFNIGVIVADKPTGPFVPLVDRPIFEPGYPIIDANLFIDGDGTPYLTYSRCCYQHPVESELADWAREKGWYKDIEESWVYGVRLTPDFKNIVGEPTLLLRPPVKLDDRQAEWESRSVTAREVNRRWTEGSTLVKLRGKYYIMYSGNSFTGDYYAVGYAVADKPLGPYVKAANNPIVEKNNHKGGTVRGTGHNNIFIMPNSGEMFCVYHGRTEGDARRLFIDRMTLHDDGTLTVEGPTTTPQPVPSK